MYLVFVLRQIHVISYLSPPVLLRMLGGLPTNREVPVEAVQSIEGAFWEINKIFKKKILLQLFDYELSQ